MFTTSMLSRFVLFITFLLTVLFSVSRAIVPGDEMTYIPGYGAPPTRQFSGYIPVDDAQSLFLHYWFVTSSNDPKNDPVAIWMNGGPGCSSLDGGLYELGPFTFTGKLNESTKIPEMIQNVNSWTSVASIIFLEQPAGVGFSYAVNGSMESDDYIQSQNTYGFILNFFKSFHEFAANDFFITGESYAGIYVPTLAGRIVDGNAAGNPRVNLQGVAVGNGCWGNSVGACSLSFDAARYELETFYGHGLISTKAWNEVLAICTPQFNMSIPGCREIYNNVSNTVGDLYPYNIYDTCTYTNPSQRRRGKFGQQRLISDPVVCLNPNLGSMFLDNLDVRKAFHVENSKVQNWTTCGGVFYGMVIDDVRPIYRTLIENKIRVLIYSGDADFAVPWVGSYEWVRGMNYTETRSWSPWLASTFDNSREWTGGYVTDYGILSYLTIKHAGHLAPQTEPEAARAFFTRFIRNQPI